MKDVDFKRIHDFLNGKYLASSAVEDLHVVDRLRPFWRIAWRHVDANQGPQTPVFTLFWLLVPAKIKPNFKQQVHSMLRCFLFLPWKLLCFQHTSPWRNTAMIYRVLVFFKVDKKLHAKRSWIPQIYCVLPSNPWKKLLEACMRAWKSQGRIVVESGWFELKNLMTLLKKMRLLRNKRRPVELLSSATAFIFWQTSAEGCRFWKP